MDDFASMPLWLQEYNLKYVDLIEEQLNEALTTYRKPVDGDNYVRRSNQRQEDGVYCHMIRHRIWYNIQSIWLTSLLMALGYKDQMSISLCTCMASWSMIRQAVIC